MAYGLKYRLNYCSVTNVPLRLEIHKLDYTGAVINVAGTGEPFTTTYKDTESKDEGISSSSSAINLIDTGAFSITDLYTSDERTFRAYFYSNNQLAWTGWLMPDYIQSEYKDKSAISLPVTDGLAVLKNIPYLNDEGNVFTGRQSLLTVVVNCLKRTDLGIDIQVLNGITCAEWSPVRPEDPPNTINTILSSTFIHSERFSDYEGNVLSCYDILETTMTLLSSTLRQEGGKWSIFNIEQRTKGIGNIDSFSSTGSRLGRTPLVSRTIQIGSGKEGRSLRGMTDRIDPVYYNTEIYSEHGPYLPFIDNIKFENFNAGQFPGWTNTNGFSVSNSDIEVERYNSDGTISESKVIESTYPKINSGVIFKSAFPMPGNTLDLDNSPYMKSSSFPLAQGEKATLRIGVRGFPQDKIYVVIKAGEYYLMGDGSWSKTATYGNYIALDVPKSEDRPGNLKPYASEKYFEVTTSVFPSNATAEFRIYGHDKGGDASKNQLTVLGLEVIKETKDVKLAKGIIFSVLNAGSYSYIPDRKLTLFSDFISAGVSYAKNVSGVRPSRGGNAISNPYEKLTSVLTNRDDELTENWNRVGIAESRPLNQVSCQSISFINRKLTKTFGGDVRCSSFATSARFSFDCNNGLIFLFISGQIRYKESVCSGSWAQMNLVDANNDNSIYAQFEGDTDKKSGVTSLGGISSGGGGGGSADTLDSVSKRNPVTEEIITAKGVRAQTLLELPDAEPAPADRVAGKTYVYAKDEGHSGQPIPGMGNLEELQNVADTIANGMYLFKGSDGIWKGASIDLNGFATQSWVNSGFVPITRTINGKALIGDITLNAADVGALTIAVADGKYVSIATKQVVTGAKHFAGAIGLPNAEPTTAQREAGVTYIYSNGDGSGSTNPPTMSNLEDLQNAQSVIANGKYLQKIGGIWTGVDINIPSLAGYALESWVANGFVPVSRTVNGKALSGNISLTAADVGALSQSTADGLYVTLGTKQTITGAKNFSAALGIPAIAPIAGDRVAGVTYLYATGDGSGSTPAPILGNLEDLANVASTIANGMYLFKGTDGIWKGASISMAGYALESWVTNGFAAKNDQRILNGQTAFGWGDHKAMGYWNNAYIAASGVSSADANTVDPNGGSTFSYTSTGWLANSAFNEYGGLITFKGNSNRGALQLQYGLGHSGESGSRIAFRTEYGTTGGTWRNWKEIWHSGNSRSNADNDARYIYRTGDTINGQLFITGYSTFSFLSNRWYTDNTGADVLYFGSSNNTNGVLFKASYAAQQFQLRDVNNAVSVWINMTDGSSAFNGPMTIRGNNARRLTLQSLSATGNNYIEFQNSAGVRTAYLGQASSATDAMYYRIESASDHIFLTGGSVRMRVLGNGNVDILNDLNLGNSVLSGSGSSLRITTPSGWTAIGPANTGWSHFSTDRPAYHFDKMLHSAEGFKVYNNLNELSASGLVTSDISLQGSMTISQTSATRNRGIIGLYLTTAAAAIWAMGSSYMIDANGLSLGNLYGMAYRYQLVGGGGGMNYNHSVVFAAGGSVGVQIGLDGRLWAKQSLTAPIVRATRTLGIPTGAPPVADREAGVTYIYAI